MAERINVITPTIRGVQCDNPACDFSIDHEIGVDQMSDWLNVPCPVCGEPLLTQRDYEAMRDIVRTASIINRLANMMLPRFVLRRLATRRPTVWSVDTFGTGEVLFGPSKRASATAGTDAGEGPG